MHFSWANAFMGMGAIFCGYLIALVLEYLTTKLSPKYGLFIAFCIVLGLCFFLFGVVGE